jgi:hypothetical protein
VNTEIKTKWVKALRSGEYEQTKACLNDGVGMCCLGVLTDLYRQEKGGEWGPSTLGSDMKILSGIKGEETSVLPAEVTSWAEVDQRTVHIFAGPRDNLDLGRDWVSLANLNDEGLTFSQIADIIEYFE